MQPGSKRVTTRKVGPAAGSEVRQRVESLGTALANGLSAMLAGLPKRTTGPQRLAEALGITTVTASRLLKALGQADPVATLQLVPGPKPLREVIAAAGAAGAPPELCARALNDVEEFDQLIRTHGGDRGALRAMLSAWLPEERRDFEAQRRQTIYKATAELEGVSSELELNAMVLFPSDKPGFIDIVSIKGLLGIDRIRPDACVKLATRRLVLPDEIEPVDGPRLEDSPRMPLNLDGDPAVDGLHTVRLDAFCAAPPAPLEARTFGQSVQYSLGPTGFGPASKVDLVIAEVNRAELPHRRPGLDRTPYFFTIPEMATRRLVFDLLIHEDVYGGTVPTLMTYDTTGQGPAAANDPARQLDLRPATEPAQSLGVGLSRLRVLEFPRYTQLIESTFERLKLDPTRFRSFRYAQIYPLLGRQITFAFVGEPSASTPPPFE
ncbi:MAG: hypothetical protein R3F49_15245 [Planctomycetota bacterium]